MRLTFHTEGQLCIALPVWLTSYLHMEVWIIFTIDTQEIHLVVASGLYIKTLGGK